MSLSCGAEAEMDKSRARRRHPESGAANRNEAMSRTKA
jgi:hypothetical protein